MLVAPGRVQKDRRHRGADRTRSGGEPLPYGPLKRMRPTWQREASWRKIAPFDSGWTPVGPGRAGEM